MEFKSWAAALRRHHEGVLRAMLTQVTPEVKATLDPKGGDGDLTFRLCEGLFIAKKA